MFIVDALQFSKPARQRFEEWNAGSVTAVHVTVAVWENCAETMREIGRWRTLLEDNSDLICEARTTADIEAAHDSGRTAVILGFQNSTSFENDLDLVGAFVQAGVRIAQLTYNTQNSVGSGCWEGENGGLSRTYGRNLIREMNDVGMLVDVSHCNERTALDAFEAAEKPVAITHANPIDVVGKGVELSFRNKSITVLKELAAQGGVVGLSMNPRLAPNGTECTLDDFCDMVFWTIDLLGVDHVGFGSDFHTGHSQEDLLWWRRGRFGRTALVHSDGFVDFPKWFDSSRGYPSVLERLRERGLDEPELASVAGGNWVRLFKATFAR